MRVWLRRMWTATVCAVVVLVGAVWLMPGLMVPLELFSTSFGVFPFAPPFYWGAPVEAHVIEKGVGRSLSGVIVVAHWQFTTGSGGSKGEAAVAEAVTDSDGSFHFQSWGPIWRPLTATLAYKDPELLLFAPGYQFRVTNNAGAPGQHSYSLVRSSAWNGATLTMEPMLDDMAEYGGQVRNADDVLSFIIGPECYWKKTPRFLLALGDLAGELVLQGMPSARRPRTIEEWGGMNRPFENVCGPLTAETLKALL